MHNFGSECGKKLNEREFEKRFIERKALNAKLPRCPSVILFPSRFTINLTKHFWVNSRDGLLNVQPRDIDIIGLCNWDSLLNFLTEAYPQAQGVSDWQGLRPPRPVLLDLFHNKPRAKNNANITAGNTCRFMVTVAPNEKDCPMVGVP